MITKAHRLLRQALAPRLLVWAVVAGLPILGASAEAGEGANRIFALPLEDLMNLEIASATKYPVRVGDIPGTVIIVSRADIEAMGYVTLEEILVNVPGLYAVDTYGDFLVGVRGNLGGSVAFLVDGVPQHPTRIKGLAMPDVARFNIPVEAIERIEIVRGPMAVIYGSEAFFGSVNVVTTRAESGSASASYGTRDTSRLFGRLAKNFKDGFVSASVGSYKTAGIEGAYADMMSEQQVARLQPGMHGSIGDDLSRDNLSALFSAGYRDFRLDLRTSRMDYGMYLLTPPFGEGNRVALGTDHASLGYSHPLAGSLDFALQVLYSREEIDLEADFLTPAPSGGQQQESERLEGEVTLRWEASPRFTALGGYRYRNVYGLSNRFQYPELRLTADSRTTDSTSNDLFLHLQGALTERLQATAGLRWSHRGAYSTTVSADFAGMAGIEPTVEYPADDRINAQAGAVYAINDRHSFKALLGNATQDNRTRDFVEPEEITTYELDYVATAGSGLLTLGVFRNDIDNIRRVTQHLDPDSGRVLRRVDNSGRLRTYGAELLVKYAPASGVDLEASGTWQETEDLENPDKAVGYSPHLLATAKATWRIRALALGLAANYVGAMEADWQWSATQQGEWERIGDPVDAYTVVTLNARYTHPGSGLYASFHLYNLFDDEIRYPASMDVDLDKGGLGPGRRFLATLGWNF